MGSLALAGAIEGTGRGMTEAVTNRQAREEKDLDREHDTAIANMRNSEAMARQTQRQEFTAGQAEIARENQLADLASEGERAAGVAATERGYEIEDRDVEDRHEFLMEALKQYDKSGTGVSGTVTSGKWEMRNVPDTMPHPDIPGMTIQTDRLVVKLEGSAGGMEQFGTKMLPFNVSEKDKAKGLAEWTDANGMTGAERRRKAESRLLDSAASKNDLSKRFLADYGYLPMSYFDKLMENSKGAFGKHLEMVMRAFNSQPTNSPPPAALPPMDDTSVLAPGGPGLLSQGAQ